MDCLSFLIPLIIVIINCQPISGSCENVNECVNKILSRHPKHKEKEQGFRHACRHACEWRERGEAQRNGTLPTRPKLTPKQQAWLDSLKASGRRAHPTRPRHPNQNATTAHPRQGRSAAEDKAIRKEIRVMSDDERTRLFDAFNALKTKPIDGKAMFDILIYDHYELTSPEAHQTAAFLPYHREMLYMMETALRIIDPEVSLAYWASAWDYYLPNPTDSILWTDLFLGGNKDVTTGPFKNWKVDLVPGEPPQSASGYLYRDLVDNYHLLYSTVSLEDINNFPDFKYFTACEDFLFEGLHGSVHAFVGGYMDRVASSPNDPVFYMHHAFVDSLWEAWRFNKKANAAVYLKDSETCGQKSVTACGVGVTPCRVDFGSATMSAFKIKVEDAMSNVYTESYYEYDYIGPHGTADLDQNSECSKSPYIYYHDGHCLSKIRKGGNCKGFDGEPICYDSTCVHGVCV